MIPISVDQLKSDAALICDAGIELFVFLRNRSLLPAIPDSLQPRAQKTRAERKKRREALKGRIKH